MKIQVRESRHTGRAERNNRSCSRYGCYTSTKILTTNLRISDIKMCYSKLQNSKEVQEETNIILTESARDIVKPNDFFSFPNKTSIFKVILKLNIMN